MQITDDKYYVSEIFKSIQGEGNYAGANCLFIRFHFCNLTCTWCDTKYTWYKKSGPYKEYTTDELREIIRSSKPHHIIFTGGEPALYRLDMLAVVGKKYHVETNATLVPVINSTIELGDKTVFHRNKMELNVIKYFNWVVSPKLSNSKQKPNEEALKYWAKQEFCIFKFIVKSFDDLDEAEQLIEKIGILKQKVYIGLEGVTVASQLKSELVDEIIDRGFNYSPRLQILLWENERGK